MLIDGIAVSKMSKEFLVLTTPPPAFSEAAALKILHDNYGIEASISDLASERDQNFRVEQVSGVSYVLKFANPAEAPEVTDFQIAALTHVQQSDPGFPAPTVVLNLNGGTSALVTAADGRSSIVRLLSWQEGVPLNTVVPRPDNMQALGEVLARLGIALRHFEHPASDYYLLWDLKRAAGLLELIDAMEDKALKALCRERLLRFKSHTEPELKKLRSQVIYADFHFGNVLVDSDNPVTITGVIDFGDIVRSPLIIDIAVAAAYQIADGQDPLANTVSFLGAYTRLRPLHREEVELLYDLILTRNVMTLVIGRWRATLYPDNSEYLLESELEARKTIEILTGLDQSLVTGIFLKACRL
jgi:Ser/Thr protein kinase RdoA (MazF antagonist)